MIKEKQEFHFYIGNDSINKNSKSDNKLFAGNIDFIKGIKSTFKSY